jgi:hypothetical protein
LHAQQRDKIRGIADKKNTPQFEEPIFALDLDQTLFVLDSHLG